MKKVEKQYYEYSDIRKYVNTYRRTIDPCICLRKIHFWSIPRYPWKPIFHTRQTRALSVDNFWIPKSGWILIHSCPIWSFLRHCTRPQRPNVLRPHQHLDLHLGFPNTKTTYWLSIHIFKLYTLVQSTLNTINCQNAIS